MSETKRTIAGIEWQPKGYSAEDWIARHKGVSGCAWTSRSYVRERTTWVAEFAFWRGSRQTLLGVCGFKTMRGAVTKLVMLTRKMGANV